MEVEEHFYSDDPGRGPSDARTTLEGVDYFFLGNGHVQAAVQVCPAGTGTPVGLLVMNPARLGPKRSALTFDPGDGLKGTMVRVESFDPSGRNVEACWSEIQGTPAVRVRWGAGEYEVEELFYCPDRDSPSVARDVNIRSASGRPGEVAVSTGVDTRALSLERGRGSVHLKYEIVGGGREVETSWCDRPAVTAPGYWEKLATCAFDSSVLDHLFNTAKYQLPAAVGAGGEMDGSIWQYNLEWVRDQAMVVRSLVMMGDFELARVMLTRLLENFVTDEGDTVDSGRRRPWEEIELDQNGELLHALKTYVDWSGDSSMLHTHWEKVHALAEFPLSHIFRHEASGLMHNFREYWERHAIHGIEDGMELTYQFYVSLGLSCAAKMARMTNRGKEAIRWEDEARRIKDAMLNHEKFGLVDQGRLIKRRAKDGRVQRETTAAREVDLPEGIPLLEQGPHYLDPDTSSVLPIAMEFVDPASGLARNTLAHVEELWNMRWEGGGYGRYHTSSEPDSPGPWPFASLFVARACLEAGDDEKVWRVLRWLGDPSLSRAGTWLEFYGPRPVPPYPQVGITPWTWAEMICFFIHHLLGVRPDADELRVRPRLLNGVKSAKTSVRLRDHMLHLEIHRRGDGEEPGCFIGKEFHPCGRNGLSIPIPDKELRLKYIL